MITQEEFKEMLEEAYMDVKNMHIEDSLSNEQKITFSKIKSNDEKMSHKILWENEEPISLEKHTLEIIYKKCILGKEPFIVEEKVCNIYGFDLILRKKVEVFNAKEEHESAKKIGEYVVKALKEKLNA